MEIELFVFLIEAFKFSKFHKNEFKHNLINFNRSLTVTFKVKNS